MEDMHIDIAKDAIIAASDKGWFSEKWFAYWFGSNILDIIINDILLGKHFIFVIDSSPAHKTDLLFQILA